MHPVERWPTIINVHCSSFHPEQFQNLYLSRAWYSPFTAVALAEVCESDILDLTLNGMKGFSILDVGTCRSLCEAVVVSSLLEFLRNDGLTSEMHDIS